MGPSEVAGMIGVSPVTIRAWSDQFARFLSPTGAGGDGRHRAFTETDVRVLYFVRQAKASGQKSNDIFATLTRLETTDDLISLPMPDESPRADMPVMAIATADERTKALLREIVMKDERIAELVAERHAERDDRERLLREIADLQREIGSLSTELRLYQEGRLKPKE
jgi:DNA-binding transcriptional MerR regulator